MSLVSHMSEGDGRSGRYCDVGIVRLRFEGVGVVTKPGNLGGMEVGGEQNPLDDWCIR